MLKSILHKSKSIERKRKLDDAFSSYNTVGELRIVVRNNRRHILTLQKANAFGRSSKAYVVSAVTSKMMGELKQAGWIEMENNNNRRVVDRRFVFVPLSDGDVVSVGFETRTQTMDAFRRSRSRYIGVEDVVIRRFLSS